jgi:transposase
MVNKYVYHLPVYRQSQQLENESGFKLADSTLYDTITNGCEILAPLAQKQKEFILGSGYLQVDETPIKVLDKDKKGTTHKGYYWVYQDPVHKMVYFDYRPGRGREGPKEILQDFKGYLQCDGYEVYTDFGKNPNIQLLNCWAHARRKFDESLDNDRTRAQQALELIQKLYLLERQLQEAGLQGTQVIAYRQERAVPILEAIKSWLMENYAAVLPKSSIGKAIHYTLERWDKLCLYTTHQDLRIDNNLVENAIRPVALGRKNYLFAGSHKAAQRAALVYSLMASCKNQGIDPYAWLADVYDRIADHPINAIEQLLPAYWTKKN